MSVPTKTAAEVTMESLKFKKKKKKVAQEMWLFVVFFSVTILETFFQWL